MLYRCYIKLSLVNILENVFVFIEILFKMLLFKGGVLIYAEHYIYIANICNTRANVVAVTYWQRHKVMLCQRIRTFYFSGCHNVTLVPRLYCSYVTVT